MRGLMMGKAISYEPGPTYYLAWFFFFFLPFVDTDPNGAYDWVFFDVNEGLIEDSDCFCFIGLIIVYKNFIYLLNSFIQYKKLIIAFSIYHEIDLSIDSQILL